ncbi:kinase-like protein, partial [Fragilariopsis cylindrus CCMP1102]
IGEGSFGNVYRATKKEDGIKGDMERKYYAVKKLKETFSSWDDVLNKREYHAIEEEEIRGGINHLVRVFEILREQDSCLYFVMEYMADGNLQDFISRKTESRNPIKVRSILYQTFLGLRHVHNLGYVHRDIKPENIMLHGRTVKLGDFSLARTTTTTTTTTTRHHETSTIMMTDYVGTRWYRAPEILTGHLSNTNNNHKSSIDPVDDQHDYYCCYTETVDTFAMGLVAAELYRCFPLFHGRNNTEQLKLIKDMLFVGKNDDEIFFFEQKENDVIIDRLAHAIPTADFQVVSFIRDLLYFRPERRPSTQDILRHNYF